jgi:hypothetical protein
MIPVKTQPRFRCEHSPCKKTTIKHFMEKHEVKCFFNPNRICPDKECENATVPIYTFDGYKNNDLDEPCLACKKFEEIQDSLKNNHE